MAKRDIHDVLGVLVIILIIAIMILIILMPVIIGDDDDHSPETPTEPPTTWVSLEKGMTGDGMGEVQQRLNALDYLRDYEENMFDDRTEEAVTAFQKRNDLPTDGIVDEATYERLVGDSAVAQQWVWVASGDTVYHCDPDCCILLDPTEMTLDSAVEQGYTPCDGCCGISIDAGHGRRNTLTKSMGG